MAEPELHADFGRYKKDALINTYSPLGRILFCVVNVLTLWTTSALAADSIAGIFIIRPQLETISQLLNETKRTVTVESDKHVQCNKVKAWECDHSITKKQAKQAAMQQEELQKENSLLHDKYNLLHTFEAKSLEIRKHLSQQGGDLKKLQRYQNSTEATGLNCSSVASEIEQSAALTRIQSTTELHLSQQLSELEKISSLAKKRNEYDFEFMNNKQKLLDALNQESRQAAAHRLEHLETYMSEQDTILYCLSAGKDVSEKEVSCRNLTVYSHLLEMENHVLKPLLSKYRSSTSTIASIRQTMTDFQQAYNSWKEKLKKYMIVRRLVSENAPVFSIQGFEFLDAEEYSEKAILEIEAQWDKEQNSLLQKLQEQLEREELLDDSWMLNAEDHRAEDENYRLILASALRDYNPPDLLSDIDLKRAKKNNADYLLKMKNQLREVSSNVQSTLGSKKKLIERKFIYRKRAMPYSTQIYELLGIREKYNAWHIHFYPRLTLDFFADGWDAVTNFALIADSILRLLRSVYIIHKYWTDTLSVSPVIDLRVKRTERRPTGTVYQRVAYTLAHPAFGAAVAFVFMYLIGATLILLYRPIFMEYTRGCSVDTDYNNNGTFITRNVNTILQQYASQEGDRLRIRLTQGLFDKHEYECNRLNTEFESNLTLIQDSRLYVETEINNICNENSILRGCFELRKVNITIHDLSEQIEALCSQEEEERVKEVNLQCDAVSLCTFDCPGPTNEFIAYSTWRTGCIFEWMIHSMLIRAILSVIVFTLLNISRLLLMKGLKFMYWRILDSQEYFQVWVNCLKDGQVVFPTGPTIGLVRYQQEVSE